MTEPVAIDPAAPEGSWFADPARFDAVVASLALDHIPDLGGELSKLQRLLVPEAG
jgi:hypothetical protein